jgi:Inner membrane protein YgaP-like, transmembrane domain
MKTNMGAADRAIRVIFVAIFALLYFSETITGILSIILGIITVLFVFSSFTGFCPLYYPFNISSMRKKNQ